MEGADSCCLNCDVVLICVLLMILIFIDVVPTRPRIVTDEGVKQNSRRARDKDGRQMKNTYNEKKTEAKEGQTLSDRTIVLDP